MSTIGNCEELLLGFRLGDKVREAEMVWTCAEEGGGGGGGGWGVGGGGE